MKIFIDLVILINFVYDFIILMSVSLLLKKNISYQKIFLGSLMGLLSIITLFVSFNNIVLFLFKILLSILMVYITFGTKRMFYNLFYFYIITIILGGSGYLLENKIIPLFLSPLILFFYIKEYKNYKISIEKNYKVIIIHDNKTYELDGFMDTGNNLVDPITHLPVIMLSDKYKIKSKTFFLVPYKVIDGNGILKCYKLDKVVVDGVLIDCLVAFIKNDVFKNKDVILNEKVRLKLC